jgi:hypothetical protein
MGQGNEKIPDAQKNKDDFQKKHDARQEQRIGDDKHDAAADAFMPSAEKKSSAEADKYISHGEF